MKRLNGIRHLGEIDFRTLDWGVVAHWPWPGKGLLMGLVFVTTLGMGYQLHLQTLGDRLQRARDEERLLKDALQRVATEVATMPSYRQQIDTLEALVDSYGVELYPEKDPSLLLQDISNLASSHGLRIVQVVWLEPADSGVQQLQLEMAGTYHAFGAFLGDIGAHQRLLTVDVFEIRPSPPSELKIRVDISAHHSFKGGAL